MGKPFSTLHYWLQRIKSVLDAKDLDMSKGPFTPRSSSRSPGWVSGASAICNMLSDCAHPCSCQWSSCLQMITYFLHQVNSQALQDYFPPAHIRAPRWQTQSLLEAGTSHRPKWRWRKNTEDQLRARKAWNIILTQVFEPQPRKLWSPAEVFRWGTLVAQGSFWVPYLCLDHGSSYVIHFICWGSIYVFVYKIGSVLLKNVYKTSAFNNIFYR